ncbi:MAG: transaldolase [Candidatus Pacebacteria bacterium]|nr:transaldolase [Candidatus Paceibacterota bacterium]
MVFIESFKRILGSDKNGSASTVAQTAETPSQPPVIQLEFNLHPQLKKLSHLKQSVWWDSLGRGQINDGSLARLVAQGVTGVTSNPVIFEQAIVNHPEIYDADMAQLVKSRGATPMNIYETLAIKDVQDAADLLRPVYDQTGGLDGYVSFEVSPDLAHRTRVTIEEAHRLAASIQRPNLMIKIPATRAGLDAIRVLTADGLNINVTLIFDRSMLQLVADAYMTGLEKRANQGKSIDSVSSVASFFISRIDTAVDTVLNNMIKDPSNDRSVIAGLMGQVAIANAKLAWQDYQQMITSPRWKALAAIGAKPQRLLWASTGTKNPDYSDLHYVETLVGGNTVNTMPPATLAALLDHGNLSGETLTQGAKDAEIIMDSLDKLGIDFNIIAAKLNQDGIRIFVEASERLFMAISRKQTTLAKAKN